MKKLIISLFFLSVVCCMPPALDHRFREPLGSEKSLRLGELYVVPTALAQGEVPPATIEPTPEATATPLPATLPLTDLTQKNQEIIDPWVTLLEKQKLGSVFPFNFLKYAIRGAIYAGVPANTIVLLLLLPVVALVIAAARHLIGLRGFGIFLPAALSVVFLATGPILGLLLFLVIVTVSLLVRFSLRTFKVKLQYLPRMAMLLLFVVLGVLGVLFLAPLAPTPTLTNVSIFPVLILVLLAEDFSRVQLGKNAKTAVNLTSETLLLALVSYGFLILKPLREFALLYPETLLLIVFAVDFALGKYVGLRFLEFWRYRKLISS